MDCFLQRPTPNFLVWTTRGSFQVACFHSWRALPGSFVPPLWAKLYRNSKVSQHSPNCLSMLPGLRHWALLGHKPYYQLNDGCSCKKNLPNAIIKWLLALFKQLSPLLFGVVTKSQSSTSFVDFWEWSGRVLLGCFSNPWSADKKGKRIFPADNKGRGKGFKAPGIRSREELWGICPKRPPFLALRCGVQSRAYCLLFVVSWTCSVNEAIC